MTDSTFSIDALLNKSVPSSPATKARARKIRLRSPNHDSLDWILVDIYWCYDMTRHQKDLSLPERILVESKWTDSIIRLLRIGNSTVMRSIRYHIMEQTSEEVQEG
jgi:hypothetical protein